jgi:hypothetical protein
MIIKSLIQDSVQSVLLLPRDPLQTQIRDLALAEVNNQGRIIFDAWPWDNSKIDPFDSPASDSDGIITFASTVDVIRAIRTIDTANTTGIPIFNQDEINAAINGETVSSERFIHLADSAAGCRRIQVDEEKAAATYKVLALKRFITYQSLASTEAGYDATRDYALVSFVIDRAEPALRAFVDDALRRYSGTSPVGNGGELLSEAKNRETSQQQRERRAEPRYPAYEEVGDWY